MFTGKGVFDFCISGNIIKVDKVENFVGKCYGKIIVVESATPDIILLLNEAIGVICEYGGITCHLALLARELSIPCLVGALGITELENGAQIKVISSKGDGVIYEINNIQYSR